jgi:flagellin-like protein
MERGNKRAISPVVATVLLIMMVIVIALIIFLWFRNISGEVIDKNGENIKMACDKVSISTSYDSALFLHISNTGTIPISSMKVELNGAGSSGTEILEGFEGLDTGEAHKYSFPEGEDKDIVLIPVLLGSTSDGDKNYACTGYGHEVF